MSDDPQDSISPIDPDDMPPLMIYVVSHMPNPNHKITHEMELSNALMTQFPGHIFWSRSTFILAELFQPRETSEWALYYRRLLQCCDGVYAHGGRNDDPLVAWADDLGLPILSDRWDVAAFIETMREELAE